MPVDGEGRASSAEIDKKRAMKRTRPETPQAAAGAASACAEASTAPAADFISASGSDLAQSAHPGKKRRQERFSDAVARTTAAAAPAQIPGPGVASACPATPVVSGTDGGAAASSTLSSKEGIDPSVRIFEPVASMDDCRWDAVVRSCSARETHAKMQDALLQVLRESATRAKEPLLMNEHRADVISELTGCAMLMWRNNLPPPVSRGVVLRGQRGLGKTVLLTRLAQALATCAQGGEATLLVGYFEHPPRTKGAVDLPSGRQLPDGMPVSPASMAAEVIRAYAERWDEGLPPEVPHPPPATSLCKLSEWMEKERLMVMLFVDEYQNLFKGDPNWADHAHRVHDDFVDLMWSHQPPRRIFPCLSGSSTIVTASFAYPDLLSSWPRLRNLYPAWPRGPCTVRSCHSDTTILLALHPFTQLATFARMVSDMHSREDSSPLAGLVEGNRVTVSDVDPFRVGVTYNAGQDPAEKYKVGERMLSLADLAEQTGGVPRVLADMLVAKTRRAEPRRKDGLDVPGLNVVKAVIAQELLQNHGGNAAWMNKAPFTDPAEMRVRLRSVHRKLVLIYEAGILCEELRPLLVVPDNPELVSRDPTASLHNALMLWSDQGLLDFPCAHGEWEVPTKTVGFLSMGQFLHAEAILWNDVFHISPALARTLIRPRAEDAGEAGAAVVAASLSSTSCAGETHLGQLLVATQSHRIGVDDELWQTLTQVARAHQMKWVPELDGSQQSTALTMPRLEAEDRAQGPDKSKPAPRLPWSEWLGCLLPPVLRVARSRRSSPALLGVFYQPSPDTGCDLVGCLRVSYDLVIVFLMQVKLTTPSTPHTFPQSKLKGAVEKLHRQWEGGSRTTPLHAALRDDLGLAPEVELLPVFVVVTNAEVTGKMEEVLMGLQAEDMVPERAVYLAVGAPQMADLWCDPVRLLGKELRLAALGGEMNSETLAAMQARSRTSDIARVLLDHGRLTKAEREEEERKRDEEEKRRKELAVAEEERRKELAAAKQRTAEVERQVAEHMAVVEREEAATAAIHKAMEEERRAREEESRAREEERRAREEERRAREEERRAREELLVAIREGGSVLHVFGGKLIQAGLRLETLVDSTDDEWHAAKTIVIAASGIHEAYGAALDRLRERIRAKRVHSEAE